MFSMRYKHRSASSNIQNWHTGHWKFADVVTGNWDGEHRKLGRGCFLEMLAGSRRGVWEYVLKTSHIERVIRFGWEALVSVTPASVWTLTVKSPLQSETENMGLLGRDQLQFEELRLLECDAVWRLFKENVSPPSSRWNESVARNKGCIFNIWGFHGGDYEEWRLLGCYAVWLL
jgi:hypothetical protein